MQDNHKKISIRRYLSGIYTGDEAIDFFSEVKNAVHKRATDDVSQEVWEEACYQDTSAHTEKEKYRQEARLLLNRIEKRDVKSAKRILLAVGSAAAILALIFSLSYIFKGKDTTGSIAYTEVYTGFGEKKHFLLPDGSEVVLNACSQLRYPSEFTAHQRDVTLRGEAYFDIAKNPEKPFTVSTAHFEVRVLGTAFNVKSYEADDIIAVNVERGKVRVEMPDATVQLRAQEQMTMNAVSGDFNKQRDNRETAVWRKGWLRFSSTPVRDVARELERMYNCRITFQEKQEFNNLISGEHDNQSLEAVLESLEFASGIKYKKENNQIVLYKKQ